MPRRRFYIVCLAFLFPLFVHGQIGSLDTNFGNSGSARFTVEDQSTRGTKLLVLDDNSIILGVNSEISRFGSIQSKGFYIHRIFKNGQLDSNFGNKGALFFPPGTNGSSQFFGIKSLPSKKIMIICTLNGITNLMKIDEHGQFDNSFGNNGVQNIDQAWAMDVQSDGKIVTYGYFFDGFNSMYRLSRYNADGSNDFSFGDNGSIISDITDYRFDLCNSILVQNDDKIIAVGMSYDFGYDYHAAISRFKSNGKLDSTFGNNGTVIAHFNSASDYGEFKEVKVFRNKIIAGGNYQYTGGTGGFGGNKFALAKFNMDGSFDSTFGNQGKVILESIFNANDFARTLEVQCDGKILIGGGASYPFPEMKTYFYIARLTADGSMDSSFGNNGIFITDFNNQQESSNYVTDLVMHKNNGFLAYGCTKDSMENFRNAVICRLRVEVCSSPEDDRILINDFSVSICKKAYFSLQPPVDSSIQNLNWYLAANDSQNFHTGLSYHAFFEADQLFYVQAVIDGKAAGKRAKVELKIGYCPLQIPNIFTPNGDGVNDLFLYHNADRKKLQSYLFNRWGNEIANWSGNKGWDGAELPEGVYFYLVKEFAENEVKVHEGKLTLLR